VEPTQSVQGDRSQRIGKIVGYLSAMMALNMGPDQNPDYRLAKVSAAMPSLDGQPYRPKVQLEDWKSYLVKALPQFFASQPLSPNAQHEVCSTFVKLLDELVADQLVGVAEVEAVVPDESLACFSLDLLFTLDAETWLLHLAVSD
jgi:hypothetical protein